MKNSNVWGNGIDELYSLFSTSPSGLTSEDARKRLEKYGPNTIPEKDKKAWTDILVSQFANPLLLIFIGASIVSAFLGDAFNTLIILTVIIVSIILGFVQEYKSEKTLSELKKYFSYSAVVMRDGEKVQIDAKKLVPGDIAFVALGDIVPADMRIIETKGIAVNESVLTGESKEVQKDQSAKPPPSANPQEIKNGLFMGTVVTDGYAKAMVLATGQKTFFGKTAAIFSAKVPESDFQVGIRKFGNMILKVILVLTFFVFIANYTLGHGDRNPFTDSALFALALAVGIAPEALPAVITITLSSGSMRLAKKKVVTKKLATIEDLGNMDILCTDKTGTLTEEGIRMERYVDLDKRDSHGVFEYAFLCNAAEGSGIHVKGNPIDVAIKKRGQSLKIDISRFKKIQEIPFDYTRRRMGQVVEVKNKRLLIVKGAPESVLSACEKIKINSVIHDTSKKEAEVRRMISDFNSDGYSTIAVAYKEIGHKEEYSKSDEDGLTFMGFVLLTNPPKTTVHETLKRLKRLNVRLKILTGDDALVTKKLCSVIGFKPAEDRIVLGSELKGMSPKELSEAAERFDIFARVTPDQKLAIIETLRTNGHVVGFLGDGINDAPALRTADVGISVDTAAGVAKGASHMILLKKSLRVVCDGIVEGRKTFGNITKYILNTMSANSGNMVTVAISSLFLPFIPLLPSQILLNNLLSDVPLMTVSSDNVDERYTKKPQKWNVNLILKFMFFFGLISTLFDLLLVAVLYFIIGADTATFRTAWFLESLLSEMIIVFSLRTSLPFFRSTPSKMLFCASVAAMVFSTAAIWISPLAHLFYFVPLSSPLLLVIAGILVAYFIATEIGKVVFFSRIAPLGPTNANAPKTTGISTSREG